MPASLCMVLFLLTQTRLHDATLMLRYPTAIEEQLGHNISMTFTFETQTNESDFVFSIAHVQENNKLVLRYDNEQETADVWSSRGETKIVGDHVDWTVVVTLNSVMVTDEGRYIIEVSESGQKETGELYIVTFAQPISLQIEITGEIKDGQDINIRCHGNVGRPHPELRLLQTNPVFNVTTTLDSYILPDNMTIADGTYDLDFTFKRRLGYDDINTTIECFVLHNVFLGKELRRIRSNSETLNFKLNPTNAADALIAAPATITLGETVLDITCSVSSPSSLDKVYSIQLLRNNSNTSPTLTVIAVVDSDGPIFKNDFDLQNRAALNGTIKTPSTAQLKLSVPASSTKCTDAVSYQCKVVAVLKSTGGSETYKKDRNVQVEVKPSSTDEIDVSPYSSTSDSEKYTYVPGTVVTLTCTGNVGNPAKLHRWCLKRVNDEVLWGYPNASHINQEVSLVYRPLTCDFRRTSRLTYNITTQDTTVEFSCEDNTNNLCESGLYPEKVTLKNYVTDDNTNTGGQSGTGTAASAGGVIAGGVIGALAGVILIALIIYFVVFRGRSSGETYDTKEDGSPGGPAHTEGPVYSVPDKKRDRSNRYVHENKGLDEPQESRPRGSPDERGHTNKMMYDDDYDNNLDGDITPSRGGGHPSEGFGSAV